MSGSEVDPTEVTGSPPPPFLREILGLNCGEVNTKNHFVISAGKMGLRSRVFTFAQNSFYKIYEAATAGWSRPSVSVAAWEKATRGSKYLDIEVHELGEEGRAVAQQASLLDYRH
jgi:hypothetical protein